MDVDRAVRRNFPIAKDKPSIPVMKHHLLLLAVEVIKSARIEHMVRGDKVTLETVTFHDSLGIGCGCAGRNPFTNFALKLGRVW